MPPDQTSGTTGAPGGTRTMEGQKGTVPSITTSEQFIQSFQGVIAWAEKHLGSDSSRVLKQALSESNPVKYLEEQVRQYDASRR